MWNCVFRWLWALRINWTLDCIANYRWHKCRPSRTISIHYSANHFGLSLKSDLRKSTAFGQTGLPEITTLTMIFKKL